VIARLGFRWVAAESAFAIRAGRISELAKTGISRPASWGRWTQTRGRARGLPAALRAWAGRWVRIRWRPASPL